MCLYTEVNAASSVAENDIEVYKVVVVHLHLSVIAGTDTRIDKTIFKSPYMGYTYNIGDTYSTELGVDTTKLASFFFGSDLVPLASVDGGMVMRIGIVEEGFHSFASLDDAIAYRNLRALDVDEGEQFTVLRCVIPAGAKLYSGKWAHRTNTSLADGIKVVDSYASTVLKVIEEVKESV